MNVPTRISLDAVPRQPDLPEVMQPNDAGGTGNRQTLTLPRNACANITQSPIRL